jgi:prepilin-type N-terminal cleavage/methylation domain-containing protein
LAGHLLAVGETGRLDQMFHRMAEIYESDTGRHQAIHRAVRAAGDPRDGRDGGVLILSMLLAITSIRSGGISSWTRRRSEQAGITLIEMLVVVAIIALFAALVAPRMLRRADTARVTAARAQINSFMTALGAYKLDTGFTNYGAKLAGSSELSPLT